MGLALDALLSPRASSLAEVDRRLRAIWPYRLVDPSVQSRVDALLDQRLVLMRYQNLVEP